MLLGHSLTHALPFSPSTHPPTHSQVDGLLLGHLAMMDVSAEQFFEACEKGRASRDINQQVLSYLRLIPVIRTHTHARTQAAHAHADTHTTALVRTTQAAHAHADTHTTALVPHKQRTRTQTHAQPSSYHTHAGVRADHRHGRLSDLQEAHGQAQHGVRDRGCPRASAGRRADHRPSFGGGGRSPVPAGDEGERRTDRRRGEPDFGD